MKYDVIVLGAGIAGLAAARTLAEAGKQVLLLEAQNRVGGRMRTLHVPELAQPIELGAEFIHGRPAELLALLEEAGLEIVETEGRQLCYVNRAVTECPEDSGAWSLLEGMDGVVQASGDMSFADYLALTSAAEEDKRRARNYVEGFNAADADIIGIEGLARQQAAENTIEGDRSARVVRGYDALAGYVAERARLAGATLLLEQPVTAVHYVQGSCSVHTNKGQWEARSVVCALPLSVLQSGAVVIAPLPKELRDALHRMRAGNVQRLVLQFRTRWWADEHPDMRFLFAQSEFPPTWWSTYPQESPLLVGWVGGPRAESTSEAMLLPQALAALAKMFGEPAERGFVHAYSHDWKANPYAGMAYSYAPAGAADASEILSRAAEQTLFFAGEHTDTTGHLGTVHGAYRSGLRAAAQVLAAI